MADFLDEKRNEIGARLKELRPLVEEYHRLEAAAAALAGVSGRSAPPPPRATRGRTRGTKSARKSDAVTARGRRGRPKGSGKRSEEAFALVKANPGITIPQIAEHMGIKQNYLYRVLPTLASEGRVQKDGRGWHPIESGAADTVDTAAPAGGVMPAAD
jgi:hypothetical protein